MYQYILICTYVVPVHTHTDHSHTSFPWPFRHHDACDPHEAGYQGDSAHQVLGLGHIETQCRGWYIQLDHPSIFHWSSDGQLELLEGAEENQVVPKIIWACFVTAGLWHSSTLWVQVAGEEELGVCSPTVLKRNIMVILLNGVRVWRDYQYSILHKSSIHSFKNRYVPVHTQYISV